MRVKRLELQGFKSFKDKTVIDFDHRITGIVGPNGCGKSNIVDAFFWVMGEQSYKHMRGSGSDDLIFNGSSKYTPLGYAEATLVLENKIVDTSKASSGASVQDLPQPLKSEEVAITRRLYRGGEGEYFINGVQVRLKDIKELFMDTGVGAKGYSVIEQGQVAKVINSKPEDRKQLIEEAAGIAKFKARKIESQRKIEAAQENLARVRDVLGEMERGLASLERQAQRARRYRELKNELQEKELGWARRKRAVLDDLLSRLRAEREVLEQELVTSRAAIQTEENQIETDRLHQLEESKRAENLQITMQDASEHLSRTQARLEVSQKLQSEIESRIAALRADHETKAQKSAEDQTNVTRLQSEITRVEAESAAAETSVSTEEATLAGLREQFQEFFAALERTQQSLMKGVQELSAYQAKSASLRAELDSVRERVLELRTRAEQAQREIHELEARSADIQARLTDAERSVTEENQRLEDIQSQIQQSRSSLDSLQGSRLGLRERRAELQSRLDSMQDLIRSREGVSDFSKSVLAWADRQALGAEIKLLFDSLDVDAGYEAIVERFLGQSIDEVVASDGLSDVSLQSLVESCAAGELQGRGGIRKPGSAFSAPLADRPKTEAMLERHGVKVHAWLADHVRSAQSGLLELFRLAIVVDADSVKAIWQALSTSVELQTVLGRGYRLVTPEGLVFAHGITGLELQLNNASVASSASFLERKAEVSRLSEQNTSVEQELSAIEAKLIEAQTQATLLRSQEEDARRRLNQAHEQRQSATQELRLLAERERDYRRAMEQIGTRSVELSTREQGAVRELETLNLEQERLERERKGLEVSAADFDTKVSALKTTLKTQEVRTAEVRAGSATIREQLRELGRELEIARTVMNSDEKRLGEITREMEMLAKERTLRASEDAQTEMEIGALVKALSERRDELRTLRDRADAISAQAQERLARIRALRVAVEKNTERGGQIAIDFERQQSEIQFLVRNVEEKYGAACLEALPASGTQEVLPDPIVSLVMTEDEERILASELEELREKIRRLGEVNTLAIEEYEELQGRYQRLVNEKLDLERSITDLGEAIEHINITSKERFKASFDAIAARFDRLFPVVFGGGSARITLVKPNPDGQGGFVEIDPEKDDVLDAGVDITAQPPGKRVVNINLLSGGEKALTAVALLFAIFMVKPSPFCVLDEVDAPLDDANIGKFNTLLKEMAAKTQFILITHNKRTMELNDCLYGVTMEEPGVSKMVSIEMQ